MNVQLSNTEEFINQKPTGSLGQVLIRYGLFPPLSFEKAFGKISVVWVC